jgi:hypothetical protein
MAAHAMHRHNREIRDSFRVNKSIFKNNFINLNIIEQYSKKYNGLFKKCFKTFKIKVK